VASLRRVRLVWVGVAGSVLAAALPTAPAHAARALPGGVSYAAPDASVAAAPDGGPVTISTTVPGQNGSVVFAATSGERLGLALSGST
jgi:hypothetical protein